MNEQGFHRDQALMFFYLLIFVSVDLALRTHQVRFPYRIFRTIIVIAFGHVIILLVFNFVRLKPSEVTIVMAQADLTVDRNIHNLFSLALHFTDSPLFTACSSYLKCYLFGILHCLTTH